MNIALHDLLACCRQLDSDKAMERKKEIEKFKRLLRDSETIQQLDQSSDSRHGKQLNWDTVFRFLQKYIKKEMESARLAKPNVSASTQATRQKKMQEISSLVKYFIRCANKRAPRLKCQELLMYIMDTISDPSSYATYGSDCSSILLKDILTVRKYWCEISSQQWSDLQTLYFKLFLKPSRDTNKVLVARIIYTLTKGMYFQTDELKSSIFNFFSKAVQCARQESNSAGLEYIFAAMNVFFSVFAVSYRMRVCRLGDEILPTVLYIWAQYRPKDSLKEQIVQLVQIQVRVHHSNGAKTQEEGACDSTKWRSVLYNLYDLLANEINLIGSRGKYSSGSRSIALKDNLVELMADVCHQIFTESTQVMEISHPYAVAHREEGAGEGPSKRRRIQLGWEVLRDNLQRSQKDFDVIPWLQITTKLVAKYASSLPREELHLLLNILYQLLPQQRRGERAPYVLRCLKEMAVCQSQKLDLKTSQKLELQRMWSKVWCVVVRSLTLQHTEAESFELLGVLIQGNLITIDREIWKIFSGSVCKPSRPAAQFLTLAISALEVPESLQNGTAQSHGDTCPLKETIVKWLLSCHTEEAMEESAELPPVLCSDFPQLELQKILVSLAMKNSRSAMKFFNNAFECLQHAKDEEEGSLWEIEAVSVQAMLNDIDVFLNVAKDISEKNPIVSRLIVNQKLRDTLEHNLLRMSEKLLSSFSLENTPEMALRCASLLTGVLGCYCFAGMITEEEALKSKLFHKAKSLIHYVGENISHTKSKINEESRVVSLRTLIVQCGSCLCNCVQNSPTKSLSSIFLHLLTSKLMNDLADICKHLMAFSGKASEATEMDIVEEELEDTKMEGGNQTILDLFDDPCPEVSDANEGGELQTLTGAISPLSEEHLTKHDLLLLDILKFLCLAATAAPRHAISFRVSEIRRKLLLLIEGNAFDCTKPLHLHMYLLLLKELPREENPLLEDQVVSLLQPLSDVCSFYRRDQEVCCAVLRNLFPMVTALSSAGANIEDFSEAQGHFLTVVGAFWHLANEGKCTAPVRIALVDCMKTLLQVDPYSKWAVLNIKQENLTVRDAFPHFLADSNFHVCMVAAKSVTSLFQDEQGRNSSGLLKPLPLKFQQAAFENVYFKAQEGAKKLVHGVGNQENLPDEEYNKRLVLLALLSTILCCSPVCEKQALFAVFQCVKQNGLEPHLIRKILGKISCNFGYKSIEDFMNTHLDFLVQEWLNCGYSISEFPYVLLNFSTLGEFYRSYYKVWIPQLVVRDQFELVRSIADEIGMEERQLLAHCFPKILVNILPYFACQNSEDGEFVQKRDRASKVYDKLKDESCLGNELMDNLFHGGLPEIVIELLMTLHETGDAVAEANLKRFTGELDPAPNPPYFPSCVIKATLDYIGSFYKTKSKELVAILSKNPESFQKILLAICRQASGTSNIYKKHRILMIYHFFVNLLLKEIKDGLGGAWAFVLRDVIYTVIHHINNRPLPLREVSRRSFLLCLDLLSQVCHTAVRYCQDALGSHLHVLVGTLTPLVGEQPEAREEVLSLLRYLVMENKDNENLYEAVRYLDPFPDHPAFQELRATQQKIKYSKGEFSLLEAPPDQDCSLPAKTWAPKLVLQALNSLIS